MVELVCVLTYVCFTYTYMYVCICLCVYMSVYRFLTYIGDLCVSRGVAIQRVQGMVCDVVLNELNEDVLISIRYVDEGEKRK